MGNDQKSVPFSGLRSDLRVLLVYPKFPEDTYWGFQHAIKFIGKKASMPPLGLITVAAMLPKNYHLKLVDMNFQKLTDEQISDSDILFVSSMITQRDSLESVLSRAKELRRPVVLGGPYPTLNFDMIRGDAIFVLNEAEQTLPPFLRDLESGSVKRVYARPSKDYQLEALVKHFGSSDSDLTIETKKPCLTNTPIPAFDLLDHKSYVSMTVQNSKGCPRDCEFCGITELDGRMPRYKEPSQLIAELDTIFKRGFNGSVMIVDDNFIGNPNKAKEALVALKSWQKSHSYPYQLFTEAELSIADDEDMLVKLRDAGINMVFVGLESPNSDSLKETGKTVNLRGDINERVRKIQKYGIEVTSGHIVGFDNDKPTIFDDQFNLIQAAGVPTAMVGALTALPGTALYRRLESEKRLTGTVAASNTHEFGTNFQTVMGNENLAQGYKKLLERLYDHSLKNYFERCNTLLDNLGKNPHFTRSINRKEIEAALKTSSFAVKAFGWNYLKFLSRNLLRHPSKFPEAVRLGIYGNHFREITENAARQYELETQVNSEYSRFIDSLRNKLQSFSLDYSNLRAQLAGTASNISKEYGELVKSFHEGKSKLSSSISSYFHNSPRGHRRRIKGRYNFAVRKLDQLDIDTVIGIIPDLELQKPDLFGSK